MNYIQSFSPRIELRLAYMHPVDFLDLQFLLTLGRMYLQFISIVLFQGLLMLPNVILDLNPLSHLSNNLNMKNKLTNILWLYCCF